MNGYDLFVVGAVVISTRMGNDLVAAQSRVMSKQ